MIVDPADQPNPPGHLARPVRVRPAPATLQDHLTRAYAARYRMEGVDSESLAECVARLRTAGIAANKLRAERAALQAVEQRCVVSRTYREFLDEVLAGMPGA